MVMRIFIRLLLERLVEWKRANGVLGEEKSSFRIGYSGYSEGDNSIAYMELRG